MKPPKRPARPSRPKYSPRPSRPPQEPRLSWPPAPPEPPRSPLFEVFSFGPEVEKDFLMAPVEAPASAIVVAGDEDAILERSGTAPEVVVASLDGTSNTGAGEGLSGKVYAGASWTLLSSFVNQVFGFVRFFMLARLLSAENFGIAGMAATVLGAVCVFTNVGMIQSTITAKFSSPEEQRRHVDTIWTIELARGFGIAVLMSLIAYPTARFYHDARLFPVVLVLAWIPFTFSMRNVGLGLTARDMQFARVTLVNLAETVVGVGSAIVLAWWLRSYWALVLAQLGAGIFGLILSYLAHPYRSRLSFDRDVLRQGFNFGKHIFLITLSGFIVTTLDNVLVAKVLGAAILGTYMVAFTASSLLGNIVNQVMGAVFFPSFARIGRDDTAKLGPAATRAFTVGTALLTVATAPIIALAPDVLAAFKPQYIAAAQPMRVLAVAGFFRALVALLSSILMGMNRPEIESRCKIIEAVVFVVAIYPLVHFFGMMGGAATGVLTFVVALLLRFWLAQQAFAGALKGLPALLGVSAVAIAGGCFASSQLLALAGLHSVWPRLAFGTPVCMGLSGLIFVILRPQMLRETKGMVTMLRQRLA